MKNCDSFYQLTPAIAVHVCDSGSQRSILEVLESETHVGRRTVH